jgi:ATP-dependent DNA ligase
VPTTRRSDSLLVGFYTKDGRFQYAGRVREGFTARTRAALALRLRLHGLRDQCPFDDLPHVVSCHRRHPWDQRVTPTTCRACAGCRPPR